MCEVILGTLYCVRVKLFNIFVVPVIGVALFRWSLRTCLTAGYSLSSTLVRLERSVSCVLTFCL